MNSTSSCAGPIESLLSFDLGILFDTRQGGIVVSRTKTIGSTSGQLMETLEGRENGDDQCRLAVDMIAYIIKNYVGSYAVALGGVDAICFTGGIGENAALIREKVCFGLDFMGLTLDETKNNTRCSDARAISTDNSKSKIFVIPTNEEFVIANDTYKIVSAL